MRAQQWSTVLGSAEDESQKTAATPHGRYYGTSQQPVGSFPARSNTHVPHNHPLGGLGQHGRELPICYRAAMLPARAPCYQPQHTAIEYSSGLVLRTCNNPHCHVGAARCILDSCLPSSQPVTTAPPYCAAKFQTCPSTLDRHWTTPSAMPHRTVSTPSSIERLRGQDSKDRRVSVCLSLWASIMCHHRLRMGSCKKRSATFCRGSPPETELLAAMREVLCLGKTHADLPGLKVPVTTEGRWARLGSAATFARAPCVALQHVKFFQTTYCVLLLRRADKGPARARRRPRERPADGQAIDETGCFARQFFLQQPCLACAGVCNLCRNGLESAKRRFPSRKVPSTSTWVTKDTCATGSGYLF